MILSNLQEPERFEMSKFVIQRIKALEGGGVLPWQLHFVW